MKFVKFKTLTLTLFMMAAIPVNAIAAPSAKVKQGGVDVKVVESSSPYVEAQGIFNAPVDKVWNALTDFQNYPRYFKDVEQAKIRAQGGDKANVYVKFDLPVGDLWVINEYQMNKANRRLSWKMIDGNLKGSDGSGSWTLTPYQGKTLATYRLSVKGSGASNWIQRKAIQSTAPDVFEYLNARIR